MKILCDGCVIAKTISSEILLKFAKIYNFLCDGYVIL